MTSAKLCSSLIRHDPDSFVNAGNRLQERLCIMLISTTANLIPISTNVRDYLF
jgi:hypothetical protein